jgi:predicted small secreted protein
MASADDAVVPIPKETHSMKRSVLKRTVYLLVLAMFSMNMLAACNTMAGAGKDVQKAGEKIEDSADKDKDGGT